MITEGQVMDIAREALFLIIKVSAPLLLISLVIGLIVSIFQTITSIKEQTLTFVPKLLVIGLVLVFTGSSMLATLQDFTIRLFRLIQVG